MPTLDWMGKDKVVDYYHQVPYRILERIPDKGVLDSHGSDCGNMVIHGDNLEALKALLPEYEGRVDCIYIDPPYNTGNEGWVYNDNVNDPRIRKWLGQVVGKEGEDLSRHDKWLCMMYPRLQLLQKMLSSTGLIFISIDDNEYASAKLMCDEIFGRSNYQGTIHWRRRSNQPNDKTKLIGLVAEYILCYSSSAPRLKELMRTSNYGKVGLTGHFSNPDNDPRGAWASKPWKAATGQGGSSYAIKAPDGTLFEETWLGDYGTYENLLNDNRIYFPLSTDGTYGTPRKKYFRSERESEGQCANNWWPNQIAGSNQDATDTLKELFNSRDTKIFDNPKPLQLIDRIIQMSTTSQSIVLDAFAGSGTTGEAVLRRNKDDGGTRHFILIEMGDYAGRITAQRIRKTISGYKSTKKHEERLYEKKLTASNLKRCKEFYDAAQAVADGVVEGTYDKVEGPKMDGSSIVVNGITNKGEDTPPIDSGFSFYELGPTLFVDDSPSGASYRLITGRRNGADDELDPAVPRLEAMRYVWYTETKADFEDRTDEHPYLMGEVGGVAYYFAWEPDGETTLDYGLLAQLPVRGETTVIYADRCILDDDALDAMNVRYKQIPRQIARV